MSPFLQLSLEERAIYCRQAAERMTVPLPAAVIEKDFWVCWILQLLNQLPALQGNITFKGGTSLSKAWGLIDRFSEDIDIAINRKVFAQDPPKGPEDAVSNRERNRRLLELQEKCADFIVNDLIPKLQARIEDYLNPSVFNLKPVLKGKEVNIEFEYPGALKNELGALLPVVLIELVPRADEYPNEERVITPILFDVFSDLLGNGSFSIQALAPERTFLEKLLLIHESLEGHNKGSDRKSRHYYDLYKMYQAGIFNLIQSNRSLLEIVVDHRQTFYRYNTLDYGYILTNGVRIVPSGEALTEWRSDYSRNAAMIYNNVRTFEELMDFAQKLEREFNSWVSN